MVLILSKDILFDIKTNFIFREKREIMAENEGGDNRASLMEYLKRDPITSIMYGLRIYTIFAGIMAILNPYRYGCSQKTP